MSVLFILFQAAILIQIAIAATNESLQPILEPVLNTSTNNEEKNLKQDITSTNGCPFLRNTRSVVPNSYNIVNPSTNCNNVNLNLASIDQTNRLANIDATNDCNNAVNSVGGAPFKIGPLSITSIAENQPGLIINVVDDKLVIGGTVKVKGQMPIYGSIAVNGNVPSEGSANLQVIDSIVNFLGQ